MQAGNPGIKVVGFDPSLRNWGMSKGVLIPGAALEDWVMKIEDVRVIQPVLSDSKQVRVNSQDLESAYQLCRDAMAFAKGAHAIFVEVPQGSQNARAATGYGLCVGVLGALRATGIPFIEVTPTEVKMVSVGKKTATKAEMIAWAMQMHPEANWPMQKKLGQMVVVAGDAEHMADATAAIYAGLRTNSFKQSLQLMQFRAA